MNFTNYEEMAAMILFGIGFTTLLLHKNMIKKIIGFSMMDSAHSGRSGADGHRRLRVGDGADARADRPALSAVSHAGY